MKKILLILFLLIITPCFAIKAVSKEGHIAFLKNIGLNETQIEKLEKADEVKYLKIQNAMNSSRKYRKENPVLGKKAYNEYYNNLLKEIENDYKKELSTFLSPKQKQTYLEYKSRVY